MYHTDSNTMENPKKNPSKDNLSDIANIMDNILTNMKSHIQHIQKKEGNIIVPGAFRDDQSKTLQTAINFALKDPKYMKNGDESDVLLTDAEKKEIVANAFIKVNTQLKSPESNNVRSMRRDLGTLEELIKKTDKDVALSQRLVEKIASNNVVNKGVKNSRPNNTQNRLAKKNTTSLRQQKTPLNINNPNKHIKPVIVTTKVQNPQSSTGAMRRRSSSNQKRNPSEKFDLKHQTQSIDLKAKPNRISFRSASPPSVRNSTRKPLININDIMVTNTSTNLRSRSLSIANNRIYPPNIPPNRSFIEPPRRPSTSVPATRGKPSTASPSPKNRPATTLSLVRPSTDVPSKDRPSTDAPYKDRPSIDLPSKDRPSTGVPAKDRPSTDVHSKDRPSTAASPKDRPSTAPSFKDRPSTAKSNARSPTGGRLSTGNSPIRGRPASPMIPVVSQLSGNPSYNNRPTSVGTGLKSHNPTTAIRPRSMDLKSFSRSETAKVFPKKNSEDSNNYSISKAFSGVKNDAFVKNLTRQISKEIRKNNPILMEKRAIYVQGTIPPNFAVQAFTAVEKNINKLIKPISANIINKIITKTKVVDQPVNSAVFLSEPEVKKEINNTEIHKLIPTNMKLIENVEKINQVNKTPDKESENTEQSVTKKSVSFQYGDTSLPEGSSPDAVPKVQSMPQTPVSRPITPASRPRTPADPHVDILKIQNAPLDLKTVDEEIDQILNADAVKDIKTTLTEENTEKIDENTEEINEINKQIEQMIIHISDPIADTSKDSTLTTLSEETSQVKEEKEEPSKPKSEQVIVPYSKQPMQISKTAKFLKQVAIKPNKPASKLSIHTRSPFYQLAPMSKKFLPTPLELVQDFINMVTQAKKMKKTFTVCGNFFSLRRAFAERGWIEKLRINIMDDKDNWRKIEALSNYELVEGIRNKEYGEKYRRVFLTKLLAGHQVDFYWDYLTNPFTVNNDRVKRTMINRFPYGATKSYTTKYGLSESLKEAHWFSIEGYANILFPRTYNLAIEEELKSFIDDFRMTGAISLLQWILNTTSDKVMSAEGTIPISVFNFATMQCHHFLKEREHRDIDELVPMTKECEWDVFLDKYYKLVHFEHQFQKSDKVSIDAMIDQSRYIMNKVKKYLPDVHVDGHRNMWLLKPNNGSRGYGILICRTLKYMLEAIQAKKEVKYIVQKYIERPLLIRKTKFDIRQWFLITCMPNVKIWIYKENYLRFSSQVFDLSKLHESIHLTNNSIQCRYKNHNNRSNILPDQNMWHSDTFRRYLAELGHPYAWRNIIYKGMKECLIGLFMLCQDKLETRVNSFELCGADFMLDEDFRPYLIEINSRPALYPSTKITAKMSPQVLEDVVKVVIDNARNPKASTGEFELIYTDTFNYSIPRHENNLHMKGVNYFQKFASRQFLKSESNLKVRPSVKITPIIIQQPPKEEQLDNNTNNESLQKILNLDASKVRKDVKKTLEKILGVINSCDENGETSKDKDKSLKRSKQLRTMLSEFVNIISTTGKNKIEESESNIVSS